MILNLDESQVKAKAPDGKTPLHYVTDLDMVKILLSHHADPNARDNFGKTPLLYAISQSAEQNIIKELISSGAKPHIVDVRGQSALHYSMHYLTPKSLTNLGMLLSVYDRNHSDLSPRDEQGKTPLHFVCERVSQESILHLVLLVFAGVDVNAQDNDGRTALHILSGRGQINGLKVETRLLFFFFSYLCFSFFLVIKIIGKRFGIIMEQKICYRNHSKV